jgi:uncharacterized protein (TIGR00369 family)
MIGVDGWGAPRTRPVSWYDPAIPAAAAAALPGRELLQAIIEGRLPPPPIASLVGGELVSVGDGQALFRITPDESTYNPIGMVHGGLLCTMLDSAAGCAVQTLLPAGVGFSSIEIKVSFLKALRAGDGPQRARTSAAAPSQQRNPPHRRHKPREYSARCRGLHTELNPSPPLKHVSTGVADRGRFMHDDLDAGCCFGRAAVVAARSVGSTWVPLVAA